MFINLLSSMKLFSKNKRIKVLFFLLITSALLSGCDKPSFSFLSVSKSNDLILSGSVESTQVDVNSEVLGKVVKLSKDEGDSIKAGDILATVDSGNQDLIVQQQDSITKAKQAKLDELLAGTRSEQIKQAEASVEAAKDAINTAKTQLDNAQINYNYWLDKYNNAIDLSKSGACSDDYLKDAQYKRDTANQQLLTSQKQVSSNQAQLQSALAQLELFENGSTSQAIRAARADLEQSQAALDQAKLNLSKYQIKSPVNGTYLMRNVNIGDVINVGASIGTISDLSDLWVKVYIPQKNIQLVKLNQYIDLKTQALPGKTIKGKIIYIANEAEYTPKNVETSESKENTVFKVKIKILDNLNDIKPGMTIDADINVGTK